ncbi:MAG: DUF3604 domain-containing protein, partial [Candidatus Lokiarchaeota archaeon]|nr:DUF3604 domain-containing protein [Candidatus Lokiarchaeota archaeon]
MSEDRTFHNKKSPKKILTHFILLFFFIVGAYTTTTYFFSFIGLIIGLVYFLLIPNRQVKRLGILLSWTIGITTIIINGIALSNASGAPALSTVYFALIIGPSLIAAYPIGFTIWKKITKNRTVTHRFSLKLKEFNKKLSKNTKKALKILIIILPCVFWWSVNIDLNVMIDNDTRLLWVHAPSSAQIESNFIVTVEAWDAYERLSATYKGTVDFSITSYNLTNYSLLTNVNATLPNNYSFSGQFFGSDIAYEIRDGKDNGLHTFDVKINTIGLHYLLVSDSLTKNTYWSNPIIVNNYTISNNKIYWGDIHGHSGLSDGSGTPEHHFYYARNVACLDFNALTDHGETVGLLIGGLDSLEKTTNEAYEPGAFVTFPGIEWTNTKTGHYTCIFSGNKLIKKPLLSFMVVTTIQQFWEALDEFTASTGCKALALPHHTTKEEYPQDWTLINPKYVKIVEVVSTHGESLFEQRDPYNYMGCGDPPPEFTYGTAIMDAFKMGYRMTLYASSDQHDGHPGHSLSHTNAYIGHQHPWTIWPNRVDLPYPGGLTAVFASNLTRESVFSGIENQRIYATSDHGRPFLNFTINGTHVGDGSKLQVSNPATHRELNILLAQDGAAAANLRPQAASVT